MKYKLLGSTGVFVSRICLGTMTFGGPDTPVSNAFGRLGRKEVAGIVDHAIDAGINFIDTADVYSGGESETLLGEVLEGRRRNVVLATKAHARTGPGPNEVGQSRLHIMHALEDSLRRLNTDHIDLYQIHNFDPLTPPETTLRALEDAVRQGKIRFIGCSNLAAWQVMKALGISAQQNLSRFVSHQAFYSLAGRDVEREIVPMLLDQGMGMLCWSPLAGGLLSGKFDRSGSSDASARRNIVQFPPSDRNKTFDVIDALRIVASRHAVSVARVALAWVLAQPVVTSVISGVKRPDQLADNIAALDLELTPADMAELDQASRLTPDYPGWIQTYYANNRVPAGHPFDRKRWGLGEEPC